MKLVKWFVYGTIATLTFYLAFFEFETVLREVEEDFTADERERLFQALVRKRAEDKRKEARKRASLKQVEELWSMLPENGVDVTDDQLDKIKIQRHMEKYG